MILYEVNAQRLWMMIIMKVNPFLIPKENSWEKLGNVALHKDNKLSYMSHLVLASFVCYSPEAQIFKDFNFNRVFLRLYIKLYLSFVKNGSKRFHL